MADPWTVKIVVTDAVAKEMTVTGTRTEGEEVWTRSLSGLSYASTPGRDLPEIRAELVIVFRAMYDKELALVQETAAVAGQEALLAAALNATEI